MRIDTRGAQFGMEQQARARAALTIDETNAAPGQVAHAAQIFGIATRNNQTVLAEGEINEDDVIFRQEMLDERRVVLPGGCVEQMNSRDVRLMLCEREQSADAADGVRGRMREQGKPREQRIVAA